MSSSAQRFEALQVIGVDIDSALVDQCKATVEHAFSLGRPLPLHLNQAATAAATDAHSNPTAPIEQEHSRKKRKLNDGATSLHDSVATEHQSPVNADNTDYFPSFFPSLFGTIDIRATKLQVSDGVVAHPVVSEESSDQGKKRRAQSATANGGIENTASDSKAPVPFPRNLVFFAADWPKTDIETDIHGYDVILG